jgi:hypothetical protein
MVAVGHKEMGSKLNVFQGRNDKTEQDEDFEESMIKLYS